jgi:hypothetical protein
MDNVGTVCKLTFVPSCILPAACQVERRKYLMSLMESLLRRLQAITDGEGDHIKYKDPSRGESLFPTRCHSPFTNTVVPMILKG